MLTCSYFYFRYSCVFLWVNVKTHFREKHLTFFWATHLCTLTPTWGSKIFILVWSHRKPKFLDQPRTLSEASHTWGKVLVWSPKDSNLLWNDWTIKVTMFWVMILNLFSKLPSICASPACKNLSDHTCQSPRVLFLLRALHIHKSIGLSFLLGPVV